MWDVAAVPVRSSKVHMITTHELQLEQGQMAQPQQVQQPQQEQLQVEDDGDMQVQTSTSQPRPLSPSRQLSSAPPSAGEYTSVK